MKHEEPPFYGIAPACYNCGQVTKALKNGVLMYYCRRYERRVGKYNICLSHDFDEV